MFLMVAGLLTTALSLDFSGLIDQAFIIINSLWPILLIPIGFALGLGLIRWIMSEIREAIPN
jgi:hypothetical protein